MSRLSDQLKKRRLEAEYRLRAAQAEWREKHWPPAGLRQYKRDPEENLPLFYGSYDQVVKYWDAVRELYEQMEGHVRDNCAGRWPRWIALPKFYYNVERINLTMGVANASKRFDQGSDVDEIVAKCGEFPAAAKRTMQTWLGTPGKVLVAHRAFQDLRAYVFTGTAPDPIRTRFYDCGLILSVEASFSVQDHRGVKRRKRSDAYVDPLCTNGTWSVFVQDC